ncbi:MAG: Uma2 family endonuclease [Candidatus Eremiobacteraeota bacterium]|nr:Uma2 family endonuclease [Candidatus Eremiobacteraeota bacterium]MCW5867246.1 Uma2 family endonuclease [Candidatus Eremiobacteraeota bacterium]
MNDLQNQLELISPSEYLARELKSTVKHEYVGGVVYAMSGARNRHNLIATNIIGVLFGLLRGHRCRVYNSDTKVRIQLPTHSRFYYPDAQVVCQGNPESDVYQDSPSLVVEVLSTSTRRVDSGEKREGYLTIPSLGLYLMVEQEQPIVVAYRRTEEGFVREIFEGREAVIPIPELKLALPLAEIYGRVEFGPDPEDVEEEG